MGAVESTDAAAAQGNASDPNGAAGGAPVRRRYCGGFLGGDEETARADTLVKSQRSPSVQSRTITAATTTSANGNGSGNGSGSGNGNGHGNGHGEADRTPSANSRRLGTSPGAATDSSGADSSPSASAQASPLDHKRQLNVRVPNGSAAIPQSPQLTALDSAQLIGAGGSGSGSPGLPARALTERERQEREIADAKEAKRALRKSQQMSKKLIKQIKKETAAEERARIREEELIAQAEAEAEALRAAAEYEQKSWLVAIDKFHAERRARSMVRVPPTVDAAVKFLANKENRRKTMILSIKSLDRCECDLAAEQEIEHDDAARLAMSPETSKRTLSLSKAPAKDKDKAKEKEAKANGAAAAGAGAAAAATGSAAPVEPKADAKGNVALKDHFAFKFAIRNPSNGVESTGEAWAIVYKTSRADAQPDRDGVRPCTIGEVIGGWTRK